MKILVTILIIILGVFGLYNFQRNKNLNLSLPINVPTVSDGLEGDLDSVKIIAEGFDTPWEIVFISNSELLITERFGRVSKVNIKDGSKVILSDLPKVKEIGEGGLLGMALDPNFKSNSFIYFYYTYSGDESKTMNRVVKMKYSNNTLSGEEIVVDSIPGAPNHNGGRIRFGPDGNLYITTGDAQEPSRAQDKNSLAGKILRVVSGKVEMYSYGHRNPQGIAWDKDGNLWATEHGKSGIASGLDELNKIVAGNNYGWPEIEGSETRDGMITPVVNSGSNDTWAPAGTTFLNGSLFWGGLRGQALYEGVIEGENVSLKQHFKNEFGRIRAVVTGPDNAIYITTSNKDGRGIPKDGDDKIIRIRI